VISVGALAVPGFVQRIDVVRVEGAARITAIAAG
jgi:hypothetical protein